MSALLLILDRHLWFLALAATVYAAYALQRRYATICASRPELAPAYERFLTWFVGVVGGTWVLMGVGIVAGGVPGVRSYLSPATGSAWVVLWHGAFVGLWLAGAAWIYPRGGARFMAEHPGLLARGPLSERAIKVAYAICLVAVLIAEIVLWTA